MVSDTATQIIESVLLCVDQILRLGNRVDEVFALHCLTHTWCVNVLRVLGETIELTQVLVSVPPLRVSSEACDIIHRGLKPTAHTLKE